MGFEQLAFSFAHFGLAYLFTFTASQMASAKLYLLRSLWLCSLRLVQPCFAFRLVVVPLVSSLVGGAVYANVI